MYTNTDTVSMPLWITAPQHSSRLNPMRITRPGMKHPLLGFIPNRINNAAALLVSKFGRKNCNA